MFYYIEFRSSYNEHLKVNLKLQVFSIDFRNSYKETLRASRVLECIWFRGVGHREVEAFNPAPAFQDVENCNSHG